MKRLLLALLLFSSPVFAEKYTIYTTERPPSSWSGIIDSEGYYYWFTNSAVSASADGCDMRIDGACFIKTDTPAKIIRKGIMKAGSKYWCSEDHIQARKKADPKPHNMRNGEFYDFGYGICTKNGWVTRSMDEI